MNKSRTGLAERINGEKLLSSEELFDYFAKVDLLLSECLRVVSKSSPTIAMTILEIGSEVVAKLQRNKSLFRRRVGYTEDVLKDAEVNPTEEHDTFLLECFDLGRQVARGEDVADLVEKTRLSRMFTERFVRAWVADTIPYMSHVWQATKAYSHDTDDYVTSLSSAISIKYHMNLPEHAYGLIRYVQDRLAAVDAIYSKITKAYARVILKIAKSHAMNDDHFLELFQFGFFGLTRANSSYDYILGAKYVAVAKWWVRQSILFHMKSSSGIIKISPSTYQHRAKMDMVRQRLTATTGEASIEDIATEVGHTANYVSSVYAAVRTSQAESYDAMVHDQETIDAPDQIPERDIIDVLSRMDAQTKLYMALLYGLPQLVTLNSIPRDTLKLHQIRQQVALALTA